jgi:hypothetical protein
VFGTKFRTTPSAWLPFAAAVGLLASIASFAFGAQQPAKLRVLFLCTNEAPCDAFLARLRGQTSDLAVTVVVQKDLPQGFPNNDHAEVDQADALAQTQAASVVLWWRAGNVIALLREPPPGRVVTRQVSSTPDADLGTAELEAGSLVARTAIAAALNGTPIGVEREPVAVLAPMASPPPVAAAVSWKAVAAAGAQVKWDGLPPDPMRGLELKLGIKRNNLRLGSTFVQGLQTNLDLPAAEGTLDRRYLSAWLEYEIFRYRPYSLGAQGHAGWLWTTVTPLSGPSTTKAEFTLFDWGLTLLPRFELNRQFALWGSISLDRMEHPITVGIRNASGYRPLWFMERYTPALSFGVEFLFPKSI